MNVLHEQFLNRVYLMKKTTILVLVVLVTKSSLLYTMEKERLLQPDNTYTTFPYSPSTDVLPTNHNSYKCSPIHCAFSCCSFFMYVWIKVKQMCTGPEQRTIQ